MLLKVRARVVILCVYVLFVTVTGVMLNFMAVGLAWRVLFGLCGILLLMIQIALLIEADDNT